MEFAFASAAIVVGLGVEMRLFALNRAIAGGVVASLVADRLDPPPPGREGNAPSASLP